MPFASVGDLRLHYDVQGEGEPVVLLHGHLLDSGCWREGGFEDGLGDKFSVLSLDALGHGRSDKPIDASAYGQVAQAEAVVRVLDGLRIEQAHVIGHSMGGWLGVGLAKHHLDRLLSLTLGGWDPATGIEAALPPGTKGPVPFERVMAMSRAAFPDRMAWVTPQNEPGLKASWEAMAALDGSGPALSACTVPVRLWSGRDDPRGPAIQRFADNHGFDVLWSEGDHLGMVLAHGRQSAGLIAAALA